MSGIVHIIGGDCSGESLRKAGLSGDILIWQDVLYDGLRQSGWPGENALLARAEFLEGVTGGGLQRENILRGLRERYGKLEEAALGEIVLWFDACLFDQSMLAHILACLAEKGCSRVKLVCAAEFPGIVPFHGLGQLSPAQLASLYGSAQLVTSAQYSFAAQAEKGFALQDCGILREIAACSDAPLPYLPPAAARWLREQPDPVTGNGFLQELILAAVRRGIQKPLDIFREVSAADEPPQYWGDTTLWAQINLLANRGVLRIDGKSARLPQWGGREMLEDFRVFLI